MLIASVAQAQNLFVTAFSEGKIYQITPSGAQSTFATGLNEPMGLAFDTAGNLFEADWGSGDVDAHRGEDGEGISGARGHAGLRLAAGLRGRHDRRAARRRGRAGRRRAGRAARAGHRAHGSREGAGAARGTRRRMT